jgi:catechol 2,3-dioxygenase-like lactoylglutathione lyase family enzyme
MIPGLVCRLLQGGSPMKAFILVLCLISLSSPPGHAQASKAQPPFKPVDGAFFALSVPDIAASTEWYSAKLGLEVVMQIPKQSGTAVTILEGGGLTVELIQHDAARALRDAAPGVSDPQFIHGLYKAGFVVKDFDDVVAELRSRGVEIAYGPFPATDIQKANVLIRDNAGNLIQLFGR